jgi:HPt (histidine-containing phosphotransfer) domain-containing protein
VLDQSLLVELTGGDSELADTILRDYVESSEADMQCLSEALRSNDIDEARRQAHRIKGASSTVGARQVADLCARLEAAAADGHTADIDALATLAADLADAIALVAEWHESHATGEVLR